MSLVKTIPEGYTAESAQKAHAVRALAAASRARPDYGTHSPSLHDKTERETRAERRDSLRSMVVWSFKNLGIAIVDENYFGRKLQFVTAISFDIRLSDLIGHDLRREFSSPRHLCMYVMHENFEIAYCEIAWLFGCAESTVRAGCKSFERLIEYGDGQGRTAPFRGLVDRISRECSTDMRTYQGDLVEPRAAQHQATEG